MASPLDRTRRRYLCQSVAGLVLLAILAVPAFVHSAAAIGTLRNLPAEWLPDTSPIKTDFLQFIRRFALTDVVLVSWPSCRLDDPSVERVSTLLAPLCAEHQATDSQDTPDEEETTAEANGPESEPWIDAFHAEARRLCGDTSPINWTRSGTELRDELTRPPLSLSRRAAASRLADTFVGADGEQTCVMLSLALSASDHHRTLLPMIRQNIARSVGVPVDQVSLVGGPLDGAEVDRESIRSIELCSPIASIVAAILCWICLRSLPLSGVIIAIATIGQGMVLAMVYYSGKDMNAVLIILPALVFVLTVSAGIHLSNYYLDLVEHDPTLDRVDAARRAMRMGVAPCLLATTTTVVGLSSLLLVRLQPVRMFGVIASVGVAGTLALLILILPGAMLMSAARTTAQPANTAPRRRGGWLRVIVEHPWPAIVLFLSVAGVGAFGLRSLTTSVSVPNLFQPDSDLRRQYDWFESHVGATMTGDILLTFEDQETAGLLQQLSVATGVHAAVRQVDGVGGVLSAANFLPTVPRSHGVRGTAARSAIVSTINNPDSYFNQLGYVATEGDERTWRITVRFFQTGDTDFAARIDDVLAAANASVAKAATGLPDRQPPELTMTGHVVIVQRTQQILLNDLFRSFVAAFGIILLVMIVSLRRITGGLISMIPNVLPTIVLFGLMGWSGTPLDIGSVMTASVALGIAVDDTVHLLSRFRSQRGVTDSRPEAALAALKQCGGAMFQTTLVCSLSLMAYAISDFVPTRRFAVFMFALLAIAFLGVSVLLPAIMATPLGECLSRNERRSIESDSSPAEN